MIAFVRLFKSWPVHKYSIPCGQGSLPAKVLLLTFFSFLLQDCVYSSAPLFKNGMICGPHLKFRWALAALATMCALPWCLKFYCCCSYVVLQKLCFYCVAKIAFPPFDNFRRLMLNSHKPSNIEFVPVWVTDKETNTSSHVHFTKYNDQGWAHDFYTGT
jgi:hypothetical protein